MKFELGRTVRLTNSEYLNDNDLPYGLMGSIEAIGTHDNVYDKPTATVLLYNDNRILVIFQDTAEYADRPLYVPSAGGLVTHGNVLAGEALLHLRIAQTKVQSKAGTTNPKDLLGNNKVSISKFPVIGTIQGAMAMMDGAEKYGPYNWRDKEVIASIYVDAAQRHLMSWFEGQETASDSNVHHLGHAIACCAILLDAQVHNKLVDDRPISGTDTDYLENVLAGLSEVIKAKKAARANNRADSKKA